jgi:putative ABC transport system permease protein
MARRGGGEFVTALSIALRALLAARVRALLTTLGILIGTAAVVVVVALGTGARERIGAEIANIGSAAVFVFPDTGMRGGARSGAAELTDQDAAAVRSDASAVSGVTVWNTLRARVHSSFDSYRTSVMGIDQDYFAVRGFALAEGRTFTDSEVRSKAKVVVLGKTVRTELFGSEPAVGQWLRIGRHAYRVIGLLSEKGRTPFEDQDDRVLMPIGTWRSRVSPATGNRVQLIMASAKTSAHTTRAEEQIRTILRERHHLGVDLPDDFIIRSQEGFRRTQDAILDMVTGLLGAVAAVALFIGGVGVMNIMLVSVAERTREVGIRMSIGARETDILLQFLAEALLLTTAGGALGIGLAALVSRALAKGLGWSLELDGGAVVIAICTSVLVGLCFGILPARRAARLDPVEALRQG